MKIVLLVDMKGYGVKGDILELSEGFALNLLIPTGKAVELKDKIGMKVNKKKMELDEKRINKERNSELTFKSLPQKITLTMPTNKKGILFESINKRVISDELKIPTTWINDINLKKIGEHNIEIKFGSDSKKIIIDVVNTKVT